MGGSYQMATRSLGEDMRALREVCGAQDGG